jgi:hypothetical protein
MTIRIGCYECGNYSTTQHKDVFSKASYLAAAFSFRSVFGLFLMTGSGGDGEEGKELCYIGREDSKLRNRILCSRIRANGNLAKLD